MHYFSLYFSAKITEKLSGELQLAHEHAGEKVWPRTALIDYKIHDAFIVRSGLFLIPCGNFNEYYDIDFINKMADRPYPNTDIAPSGWLDVGVQIRGKVNNPSMITPFYSLYLVNGSLQGDEETAIRKMRGHWRDNNRNKAFGGNVGAVLFNDLSLSGSYYTGKYSEDSVLKLSIAGGSLTYTKNNLSIMGEYQSSWQDHYTDTIGTVGTFNRSGLYALVSYKIMNKIEPVVRYDILRMDAAPEKDYNRITLGLNYHFEKICILKINYQMITDKGENDADDNMLLIQFATMF